jgi:AAA domain
MENERELIPLSKVRRQRLRWLWRNRVPLGCITLLDGDPGQGKSTILYDLAARLTRGRPMPLCRGRTYAGGVVLLQGEDGMATVVMPTLKAMGADLDMVHIYDPQRCAGEPLLLPRDIDLIEHAVNKVNARLVIVDPISCFVDANYSSDRSVRKALQPLAELAHRSGFAVIIARHFTKRTHANAIYQGSGSIGLIAQARSALMVVEDPTSEDQHQHLLLHAKANLTRGPTLCYRTVLVKGVTTIEWLGTSQLTARDLVGSVQVERSALRDAMDVLYLVLSNGPLPAKDAMDKCKENGIKDRTLQRAKVALDVRSEREQHKWGFYWRWQLPEKEGALLRSIREKYAPAAPTVAAIAVCSSQDV